MFLGKNLHVDESSSPVTHIKMHTIFCSASPRRDGRRRVPTIWSEFWAGRAWRLGPTPRGGRSRTRSRRAGAPPAAGSGGPPAAGRCPLSHSTAPRLAMRRRRVLSCGKWDVGPKRPVRHSGRTRPGGPDANREFDPGRVPPAELARDRRPELKRSG